MLINGRQNTSHNSANFFKEQHRKQDVRIFLILLIFVGIIPVAFADVSIQNDQKYFGDDGTMHIVGEIQNEMDAPLSQISVHATLYDKNNQIIGTKETDSLVNIIMPEMKGPFDFILTDPESKKAATYSLDVNYKVSAPKNQVIEITDSELSRDNLNNLMITGTVLNRGEITANTVAVVATLYDKEGNVAAVSRVHPEPDYLRTDGEMFFLVTIPDKTQTYEIEGYSLVAESEEYTAVPEFPIGSLVLLGGSLSTYIIVTRFSGRIITSIISATSPK